MKKIIFIFCVLVAFNISGQTFYPQIDFYSKKSSLTFNSKNDAEEYDNLKYELKEERNQRKYTDQQLIDLVYRMYEIERTSQIPYLSIDGKVLPFQCKDMSTDGAAVDFGAPLIANESYAAEGNFYGNILRFGSPITTIDPALFSNEVTIVILPSSKNLTYRSSPDMYPGSLRYLEGPDVIDHSALISNDNTLIVAATKGKEHFKIPDGVLKIGAGALRGSLLSSIELPSSVISIDDKSFDLSTIKQYFIFSETVPAIGNDAFGESIDEDARFYVPKKVLGQYKKTYPELKDNLTTIEKNKGIYYLCKGKAEYLDGNYAKGVELFEIAAENKCHEANYWLGKYYTEIEIDAKKAYSYFEKAAKKKHAESMFMCHYYPRYHSDPIDMNAAKKWLLLAIKNNSEEAAQELGNIYSDSDHEGYPLNLQEALNAYKKSNSSLTFDRIARVEKLISLGADKRIKFNPNAIISSNDGITQILYSSLQGKEDFCLYDMAITLIDEYFFSEDMALDYCKGLIDQWIDMGVVSSK